MNRLFGKDRAKLNNKDGKFAAYGLRHTFNARLAELGVDSELRGRLVGHSSEELSVSTYASGEFMKRKAAAVALLDFTLRE